MEMPPKPAVCDAEVGGNLTDTLIPRSQSTLTAFCHFGHSLHVCAPARFTHLYGTNETSCKYNRSFMQC
jgi:hypothetical protein